MTILDREWASVRFYLLSWDPTSDNVEKPKLAWEYIRKGSDQSTDERGVSLKKDAAT